MRLASKTHFVYNTYTNSKGAIAMGDWTGHPWMGNALPDLKASMLRETGAPSIEALFEQIPAEHRLKKPLKLPEGIRSEAQLRRRLTDMMARNESTAGNSEPQQGLKKP